MLPFIFGDNDYPIEHAKQKERQQRNCSNYSGILCCRILRTLKTMKLKQLFTDDDAVSPVIGVILMVAITVILAAVIATFVLGLGESVSNTSPQAQFGEDYAATNATDDFGVNVSNNGSADGILTVTHSGGDSIKAGSLYMTGGTAGRVPWSDNANASSWDDSTKIGAGNSVRYAVAEDDTVRVIWDNGEGTSAELSKWPGKNN